MLTSEQVSILLHCLDASFNVALEFDRRPGLKFLIEKVFGSTCAANLYKQTVTAWAFRLTTLFEIATHASFNAARASSVCDPSGVVAEEVEDDLRLVSNVKADANAMYYVRELSRSYWRICQTFVEVELMLHNSSTEPEVDRVSREPLVFMPVPESASSNLEDAASDRPDSEASAEKVETKADASSEEKADAAEATSEVVEASQGDETKEATVTNEEENNDRKDSGDAEQVFNLVTRDKLAAYYENYMQSRTRSSMPPVGAVERRNPFNAPPPSSAAVHHHRRHSKGQTNEEDDVVECEAERSVVKVYSRSAYAS